MAWLQPYRITQLRDLKRDAARTVKDYLVRRPTWFSLAVTTALCATVSLTVWTIVADWEGRAAELEFRGRASNAALTLQGGVNEYFSKVVALRALFDSSPRGVGRKEFQIFTTELLSGKSAILSTSWIPRVRQHERAVHEQQARQEGLTDYRISDVGRDGKLTTAPEKPEYFPVFYSSVKGGGRSVYGLDLNDGAERLNAVHRARDTNRLAVSDDFVLRTGQGNRRGFLVLLPVYQQGLPNETLEQRRDNLIGLVQGVFQINTMFDGILAAINTPIDLYLFEPDSRPDTPPVYTRASRVRSAELEPRSQSALASSVHWLEVLKIGQTKWTLVAVPAPSLGGNGSAWIVLLGCLVVSGLVVAYVWSTRRHALKISKLARTDALTNLANRRSFYERLAELHADGRDQASVAVHFIDLDHFKDVNDTLGHVVGDVLLQQVAARLENVVGRSGLVARLGGDEFAILQRHASDPDAPARLAAQIIETLSAPYLIHGNEVHITASIGVAGYPADQMDFDVVMMQADLALYHAKEEGRNCFRFHRNDLDQIVQERVVIADDLRFALQRHELELYYQPQVELGTGKIIGAEALLRWHHPKRGLVSPAVFIPIAERTGAILAIGAWVFDEACRQMRIWQDEGVAPRVLAVNFSAVQCKHIDFERHIAASLAKWNVDPETMEVELTESVLMEVTKEPRRCRTHPSAGIENCDR